MTPIDLPPEPLQWLIDDLRRPRWEAALQPAGTEGRDPEPRDHHPHTPEMVVPGLAIGVHDTIAITDVVDVQRS